MDSNSKRNNRRAVHPEDQGQERVHWSNLINLEFQQACRKLWGIWIRMHQFGCNQVQHTIRHHWMEEQMVIEGETLEQVIAREEGRVKVIGTLSGTWKTEHSKKVGMLDGIEKFACFWPMTGYI